MQKLLQRAAFLQEQVERDAEQVQNGSLSGGDLRAKEQKPLPEQAARKHDPGEHGTDKKGVCEDGGQREQPRFGQMRGQ